MADATSHLNERSRAALDLSAEAHVEHIRRPRWIGYTHAIHILVQLEALLTHSMTHRMPGLLIVGETNADKTMLVNRFVQVHPACDHPNGDVAEVPVLAMQAPPGPDESRFYHGIFEALCAPYQLRERVAKLQVQLLRLLKQINLRMFIIDEIHNIITGPVSKQRQFLNVLKYLSNELQVPLVGLWTQEALRAIQADPQLANRFTPVPLPRWRMGRDFLRLLARCERTLPLRQPSRLIEECVARQLLVLSEGSLGGLSALLSAAAIYAVKTGTEQINEPVLAAVDCVPPSERRRQAERRV
jgi:Bacterial TniB protein